MNRKRVMIAGGIFSAVVLIYCLIFGPFAYAISLAAQYGHTPSWIAAPFHVVFRPHLWVMYESESYYSYILWFGKLGGGSWSTDWKTYRDGYERHFGVGR